MLQKVHISQMARIGLLPSVVDAVPDEHEYSFVVAAVLFCRCLVHKLELMAYQPVRVRLPIMQRCGVT